MTTTINGRTPDEIKQWLNCESIQNTYECEEHYTCDSCPHFIVYDEGIPGATLAYIQQLERERDALLMETKGFCSSCAFRGKCHARPGMFDNSPPHRLHLGDCEDWQWRGPQEVE